ncbi:hypothetical protein MRB53_010439 [Persea americana]|uniref:Uncharacterized protein n=1 Tax=Persea americana TaxID=3435 RepID=A0ACC2LRZ9_PERAE|nr:hypothetical protein MRB53_010439 [Persea americana]
MPIHRVQIDPGFALNLISTSALEELGIPPSKLSHTSVSIFGYDGSAQRPIGKIRFRLQIGDLISKVTVYAIKTPSCYNILLGRPWIHENGVVPSTLHQCIKFVGDDGLIHRVFADKKPFKGKEVHFADSQMYKDEKEEKEEKTTSLAGNLQKDKGKAPQQSSEENKPSGKLKESNQSPFVISFKSSKPLQVRLALTPLETPADVEDPASATFVVPETSAEEKPIFFHRSNASSSNCLLEPFRNEELPDKDPRSSSNWYDFSDNEEELSDDTDARFSDSEEPSSPKEVPYFDPVSAGLVDLEPSENVVEEPLSNLPTEDSVQKIDLGTPDNPRPVFISKNIKDKELPEYVSFLREFVDCFARSYAEMPGLDPKIAVHKLNLQENVRPVKQGQRRFRPDVMDKIEQEVQKLKTVGFIREEQHPEWLANIVPVTKKNGQIRVYIDYRDLNNACPKDEFPLPIPEVMIDNTCGFERMTFIDGFSGYNQIKMHPEDERHTSFRTPFGVYCYTVMPFGLKNAGATYQRAVMKIFQDMQHKTVECYVDDLAVKSKRKEDHLQDLREVFLRLRKHKLRMNPLKCFFGVSSGAIASSKL